MDDFGSSPFNEGINGALYYALKVGRRVFSTFFGFPIRTTLHWLKFQLSLQLETEAG